MSRGQGLTTSFTSTAKAWLKRALRDSVRTEPGLVEQIAPAYWGLKRDSAGQLCAGDLGLVELVDRLGSPLHVVNAQRLRDNARAFVQARTGARAGCEAYFSYKTNPIPGVLSELHAAGVGAEVISAYELWLALELGVPPNKIIYNGPAKSPDSVRKAIEIGIELLNVNHREEIAVVAGLATEQQRRPRIGLRVTLTGWAGQFGIPVTGGEALAAYAEAMRHSCLDVVGLHAHRGTPLTSSEELGHFVTEVLAFTDALRDDLGLELQVIDFGGSLAVPSVRPLGALETRLNRMLLKELEPPRPALSLSIASYVAELVERVEEHYRQRGKPVPRIMVEPGRALTGDTQLLLARVLSLKDTPEQTFAILDAGTNVAEGCRGSYHQFLHANHAAVPRARPYTLVGPICSPADTLRWAVRLPELSVGDTLAIMDSGAYFVPFSNSFSFPQPAIVMIDGQRVVPLRRAERFEDLVSYDVEPFTLKERRVNEG